MSGRVCLKVSGRKRPQNYNTKRENAMTRALVLGVNAVALSAGAASAQVYPGYGYAPYGYGYVATFPSPPASEPGPHRLQIRRESQNAS
jgi:hypothetical protein